MEGIKSGAQVQHTFRKFQWTAREICEYQCKPCNSIC